MTKPRVIIVGLARNVETTLKASLNLLEKSFSPHFETEYYIVESDSKDTTKNLLKVAEEDFASFAYICLGNLEESIPDRISRIRHCRNVYVDYIQKNHKVKGWDYVVVADLDGVNRKINSKKIEKLVRLNQPWDVLTCNQIGPYYDIYALRASGWVEYDCQIEVHNAIKNLLEKNLTQVHHLFVRRFLLSVRKNRVRKKIVYTKMRYIPFWKPPISVDSAFGGIALYKSTVFLNYDYSKEDRISQECEHVSLHRKVIDDNGQILIIPSFTNCGWNEHSLNKIWLIRLIRRLRALAKMILSSNEFHS